MNRFLALVVSLAATVLVAAPQASGPAGYEFRHPEAKARWQALLPEGCVSVTPTCAYHPQSATIYLLAELCGLGEGYEAEFLLLGRLSDRAYEGLAIAWDDPSAIRKAAKALGVPQGVPPKALRGLGMAQGERFTVSLRRLDVDDAFLPLADFIDDQCSPEGQSPFERGFPYVGAEQDDAVMPCSILAAYAEPSSLLGLPYPATKGAVYGLFRASRDLEQGAPAVVALKWERLPEGVPRVLRHRCEISSQTLVDPDAFLAELKSLCDSQQDVFLDVRFAPDLPLPDAARISKLLLALEAQGGFVIDQPAAGQIPARAFAPQAAWLDREKRVFQPWEVEVKRADGGVEVALCQILEDWLVDGPDPALTRKCYPGMTPQTIRETLRQVDQEGGRVYVVFFLCDRAISVGELAPYAEALAEPCPTQWIFLEAAPSLP